MKIKTYKVKIDGRQFTVHAKSLKLATAAARRLLLRREVKDFIKMKQFVN